tara:strand:+ start:22464 stop:24746 length:2283 start_codon:yes stop_codon:yes gene_type:complete
MAKKAYYVRIKENGKLARIVADSPEDALKQSDNLDLATATFVAEDENGNALRGGKDNQEAVVIAPDGTRSLVSPGYSTQDQDKINEFISGKVSAGDLSQSMINQGLIQENPLSARVATGMQAIGFGAGSFTDEVIEAFGFKDTAQGIRALNNAMQTERPLESLAIQAGISIREAYKLAKKFPKLAEYFAGNPNNSMLSNMGRGAIAGMASGATQGGIMGAGQAEDGNRLQAGGEGAFFGGAGGFALGGATAPLAAGGRNLMEFVRASDVKAIGAALGISRNAAAVIKNAFNMGGDINTAIAQVQRAGENGMLVDGGVAARALADAAGNSGVNDAGQIIGNALENRAAAVSGDLSRTLDETLGEGFKGPTEAQRVISGRTKEARNKAYQAAYNTSIDYGTGSKGADVLNVIKRVDNKTLKEAFEEANADMLADGINNAQLLIRVDDAGNIIEKTELPNVIQLDYLKRSLQTLAEQNRDATTLQFTTKGLRYNRLARDLRQAIGDAVVDQDGVKIYNKAVNLGGDKIAEQNAYRIGNEALRAKTGVENVYETIGPNPTFAQREAAKMGMRTYIKQVLGDVKAVPSDPDLEARQLDAFYKLTSSENARTKIKLVMGDEADELLKQIDEVAQTAIVRSAFNQNSKTAIRQAIQGDVDKIIEPGPATSLLQGKPFEAAQKIVSEITGFTDEMSINRKNAIYEEIAEVLTRQGTDQAIDALRILEQARLGQRPTAEQNRALANAIFIGFGGGGQDVAREELRGLLQ